MPIDATNVNARQWAAENMKQWKAVINADASTAFSRGMRGYAGRTSVVMGHALGFGYLKEASAYYGRKPTFSAGVGQTFRRNVEGAMAEGHGIWAARTRALPGAARTGLGNLMGTIKHRGSIIKPLGSALLPGFAVYAGLQSEHGFGVGFAEEIAGFAAFDVGSRLGLHMGGWAGASAAGRVGSLATRITGAKSIGSGIRFVGGTAGLGVGFLAGGLIAFEAARWTVGFALHTLPTFSRQFQADMARQGFGGDYQDSAGAATMRARSLQVMGRSFANARSALGQEASLLHV